MDKIDWYPKLFPGIGISNRRGHGDVHPFLSSGQIGNQGAFGGRC